MSDAPVHAAADRERRCRCPTMPRRSNSTAPRAQLEFNSNSSIQALAAFYRSALKAQGWRESPSVINNPTMVVMEFAKGGKELSFTAMQIGAKVNVSGEGSGLMMANARPAASKDPEAAAPNAESAAQRSKLSRIPRCRVPKQHSA